MSPRSPPPTRVVPSDLHRFCVDTLRGHGIAERHAALVANALLAAELRGIDTHGVRMLPTYLRALKDGRINSNPTPHLVVDRGGMAWLDADGALGPVGATLGMEEAIDRARTYGIAYVGVSRSNHFGASAHYAMMALPHAIGVACTNAAPQVVPWGGRVARLGTNPIAIAAPTGDGRPFVLDMATSVVARSKLSLAAARGVETIPEGWAVDAEGRPTAQAAAALRGALLPVGGPKGYDLAIAIDILAGVLSGAAFGTSVGTLLESRSGSPNVGHAFVVIDIRVAGKPKTFHVRMQALRDELVSIPSDHGVLFPGDLEAQSVAACEQTGIDVDAAVAALLEASGRDVGIVPPWSG